MREVRFYYEYEEYGFLSNFFLAPIVLEGMEWPSVEHYYQASKSLDIAFRERIRTAPSADEAKRLGRDPACVLRDDWDEVKAEVMRRALAAKFTQHPDLRSMLVETQDAVLVENSKKDYYWGCGADDTGRSMLGALLMELRASLARDGD